MKDIPGFEGKYAATSCGKIWSYRSKRFIKPYTVGNGYLGVKLNGKNYRVHRLVAMTYIPNPEGLPHVNHKDENKHNNALPNLEWCDAKYNNNYGTKIERQITSLLGTDSIIEVRHKKTNEIVGYFISQSAAARELNLFQSGISTAMSRKSGSCGGYTFSRIQVKDEF